MSGVTYPVSHVRCHMSLVMCNVSCVICYVSYVINIFFYKVAGLAGQQGLPRLVLIFILLKRFDTQYLLISACSGPFWVIKKSKLMKN